MKIKNVILGIGILVVFGLAFHQGLETFYSTPKYEDYCGSRSGPNIREINCPIVQGLQNKANQCWDSKGEFIYEYDSNGCPISGNCDSCRIDYEDDLDKHAKFVFIIAVVVGVIAFVFGFFLLKTEPVGSALMASGIWSIFFGVVRNWRNFTDSWRFLILFVLLVVLIFIALRFNSKSGFFRRLRNKFK
jgi:hypothetical protein